jgi:hypothetical protein
MYPLILPAFFPLSHIFDPIFRNSLSPVNSSIFIKHELRLNHTTPPTTESKRFHMLKYMVFSKCSVSPMRSTSAATYNHHENAVDM